MQKYNAISNGNNKGRTSILESCRAMLRPIARLLLKSGIVHRDFVNLTREVYVDTARKEFGLRGRPTSISRIALLTGLARKEVRRIVDIIDSDENPLAEPGHQDRITRVLSGWFQDPDYLDEHGEPKPIPADGPMPSFTDLKSRYGGDVPASAILREMISAGSVEPCQGGLYRPLTRYFMPNPTDNEHMRRAGNVLEDIGNTVTHNLYRSEQSSPLFERRAINTHMSAAQVEAFRNFVDREGQQFLERVDEWLTEHEEQEHGGKRVRLGLGVYIIKTPPGD